MLVIQLHIAERTEKPPQPSHGYRLLLWMIKQLDSPPSHRLSRLAVDARETTPERHELQLRFACGAVKRSEVLYAPPARGFAFGASNQAGHGENLA